MEDALRVGGDGGVERRAARVVGGVGVEGGRLQQLLGGVGAGVPGGQVQRVLARLVHLRGGVAECKQDPVGRALLSKSQ